MPSYVVEKNDYITELFVAKYAKSMRNMRIVGNAIAFNIALQTASVAYVKPMSNMRCNCSCAGNRDMSRSVVFFSHNCYLCPCTII